MSKNVIPSTGLRAIANAEEYRCSAGGVYCRHARDVSFNGYPVRDNVSPPRRRSGSFAAVPDPVIECYREVRRIFVDFQQIGPRAKQNNYVIRRYAVHAFIGYIELCGAFVRGYPPALSTFRTSGSQKSGAAQTAPLQVVARS